MAEPDKPLKILHVLRAPVGGLFRHVLDLSREQVARGHAVGLIADSVSGGATAEKIFEDLEPQLKLGLLRTPMHRSPHPQDIVALAKVRQRCRDVSADVLHGHGAKGGLFCRLSGSPPGSKTPVRAYTPHGGSLNYEPGTIPYHLYMRAERFMAARTDLMLFESGYIAERFVQLVGTPRHLFKTVRNGISDIEFEPVRPASDAADFLYVGELRALKGIDTLLEALALARHNTGLPLRAVLVGAGAERGSLQAHAERLGLADCVSFPGPLPARQAFDRGKILIIPSRAESLPYIVLEAAGARMPMIATGVGGIPEIFGPYKDKLLKPNDVEGLAARMIGMAAMAEPDLRASADALARFVQSKFSREAMVNGIIDGYREALALRGASRDARHPSVRHSGSRDLTTSGHKTGDFAPPTF